MYVALGFFHSTSKGKTIPSNRKSEFSILGELWLHIGRGQAFFLQGTLEFLLNAYFIPLLDHAIYVQTCDRPLMPNNFRPFDESMR